MFGYQIRHATQHDFAVIIRFVHALLSEMYALTNDKPSCPSEAWLDFEGRILQVLTGEQTYPRAANHLMEIAETIGGEAVPIGLIEASILAPTPIFRPIQTLQIHAIYVLPRYRRRGVGTALLRSAISWGQRHDCRLAQLSVLPHNPARRLYQQLGFQAHGLEMHKVMTSVS